MKAIANTVQHPTMVNKAFAPQLNRQQRRTAAANYFSAPEREKRTAATLKAQRAQQELDDALARLDNEIAAVRAETLVMNAYSEPTESARQGAVLSPA